MKRAAIIGGGIGGLATAIALRKVGFDVHVYERAHELKEAGSGLSIWPNALRCLEEIDSRVFNQVRKNGYPLRRFLMKEASGKPIKTVHLPKTDLNGIAILRSDLLSALAQAVPTASIYLSRNFSHLVSRPSSVVLYFHNGEETEVDFVVGCDGIHSAVRKSLDLQCRLISRGYSVWRGMTLITKGNVGRRLGLELDGDFSESYGHGQRFGIVRLGPNRIHWYAVANESLLPESLSDSDALGQLFSRWHDPVPELIASADSIIRTKVRDRFSSLPWTRNRIATLGDAAHPVSPNFGQGACLAIEDAVVLADSLRSGLEIPIALRRYEKCRHFRCQEIFMTSREVGRFAQLQNRALVHLRKYFIKLAPPAFTTFWFRRSCEFYPPSLAASPIITVDSRSN
jgi:2-polyprenyl-6-methoxyphenol hydroxylase-like FAD-dependent oxidoreductase